MYNKVVVVVVVVEGGESKTDLSLRQLNCKNVSIEKLPHTATRYFDI